MRPFSSRGESALPPRRCRAVLIDIDGTICPESSGAYLARHLGHGDMLADLEADYAAGRVSNHAVCDADARAWCGVRIGVVESWLDELPVLRDTKVLADWASEHEVPVILASVAWRPVSDALERRFGFQASGGPELEVGDGIYTGRVRRHFDEYDKRDAALALARSLNIDSRDCVAIGDSRSDLPLFATVGTSIALNAVGETRRRATASLDTLTMCDVVELLVQLSDSRP